ncbi:uncharacterized protein VTP21DRAFT_499 [Calcarisporiella thermophila]|uniref:uncharacterized protein n=1 Tax=Calcarisporiella thermophila TaxID=911321 RepID=UPI003742DF19
MCILRNRLLGQFGRLIRKINMSNVPTSSLNKYIPVTEGKATILFPKSNEVFYNPVQQFNRDMSIAAIRTWNMMFTEERRVQAEKKRIKKLQQKNEQEKQTTADSNEDAFEHRFTILEALAASGLRSIRYAKEIPNLKYIVANDLEPDAVESIKRNMAHNDIQEDLLRPNLGDACDVLYSHRHPGKRFDVIDLDPYGTASPFIDGAVQAVSDGGLLCVTCTDMQVLAGAAYSETCFSKYGGLPLKAEFCHEMGLRLVLNMLQQSAARYKRYIVPLVSCSIDFYVRLFVRVFTSPAEVKNSASKTSLVYACSSCPTFVTQPMGKVSKTEKGIKYGIGSVPTNAECEFCGSKYHVGGPTWGHPIHNKDFVAKMLEHVKENKEAYQTHTRMIGMLTVISEELEDPLYYTLSDLSGTLHCNTPPLLTLCSAILHAGYKVSASHACVASIKTNAPNTVIWDIMRCWVKAHPVTEKNIKAGSPAAKILSVEPIIEANFTKHPESEPESRKVKLVRYQANPEKNWGPKARHKRKREENPETDEPISKK